MTKRTCTGPDCDKPMMYGRLGLCDTHYRRLRKHGSLDDPRLAAKRNCSVPDCPRPYHANGYCNRHEKHWRRHGDPLAKTRKNMTVEERFLLRIDRGDGTGCWLWTGYVNARGYGYFSVSQHKTVQAHRFAYTLMAGPIPDGLTIDHVKANGCTSKACVKAIADEFGPAHLEPVTNLENMLRGDSYQARNARKTHCKRGHPFDEANTHRRADGSRRCRACAREAARKAANKTPRGAAMTDGTTNPG